MKCLFFKEEKNINMYLVTLLPADYMLMQEALRLSQYKDAILPV